MSTCSGSGSTSGAGGATEGRASWGASGATECSSSTDSNGALGRGGSGGAAIVCGWPCAVSRRHTAGQRRSKLIGLPLLTRWLGRKTRVKKIQQATERTRYSARGEVQLQQSNQDQRHRPRHRRDQERERRRSDAVLDPFPYPEVTTDDPDIQPAQLGPISSRSVLQGPPQRIRALLCPLPLLARLLGRSR